MLASALLLCALAAQPLPDQATIAAADRLVRDTFSKEFGTADGLLKILNEADQTTDDAPAQAAMYLAVGKQATADGHLKIAFDAADRLAQRFEFDALKAKASVIASCKGAKTAGAKASLVNRCLELIDEAIAAERFEIAEDAAKVATSIVPKLRDIELRKTLTEKRKELERTRKEHELEAKELADANAAFEKDQRDTEAAQIIGSRLAVIGDWSRAIGFLQRAADKDLKDAAWTDAMAVKAPKMHVAAADKWWDVADSFDGKRERAFRSRSVYWYTLAMPTLTGILKTRAEKRIEEAGKVDLTGQGSGDDSRVTIMLAPGVPLVLVKIPPSDDGKVKGFWLGQTEVTRQQWSALMSSDPSQQTQSSQLPVHGVGPDDARSFCAKLDALGSRFAFRLPTKDEWFVALEAGSPQTLKTMIWPSSAPFAWSKENAGGRYDYHPVGQKKPNAMGLFDMVGNCWEWCADGKTYGMCSFDDFTEGQIETYLVRREPYPNQSKQYWGGATFRVAAEPR